MRGIPVPTAELSSGSGLIVAAVGSLDDTTITSSTQRMGGLGGSPTKHR